MHHGEQLHADVLHFCTRAPRLLPARMPNPQLGRLPADSRWRQVRQQVQDRIQVLHSD
jgi:hypothetical protein